MYHLSFCHFVKQYFYVLELGNTSKPLHDTRRVNLEVRFLSRHLFLVAHSTPAPPVKMPSSAKSQAWFGLYSELLQ